MKSKARDQSIQSKKKLFCSVIVKNYLCRFLCKFLTKIKNTWKYKIKDQTPKLNLLPWSDCQKQLLEVFYKKNAGVCNVFTKETPTQVFSVDIVNFLRLPVLEKICEQHQDSGSESDVRFLILIRHLILNQFATYIEKPKPNNFDESIKFLDWLLLLILDNIRSF